ncbi:MAG: hypothetical protein JXR97_00995 [Planctomycetes bacterium]|nr:hypothetical protein [Planctomycetota bacterium]
MKKAGSVLLCVMLVLQACLFCGCDDDYETGGYVGFSKGGTGEEDSIDATMRELERLKSAPVPKGNVRINITRIEAEEGQVDLTRFAVGYKDNNISVKTGHLGGRNGSEVFALKDGFFNGFKRSSKSYTHSKTTKQFMVLMPGSSASMQAVEEKRIYWAVVVPVWRGSVLVSTIEERVTGTGMNVRVNSANSNNVSVELLPYFNRAERRGRIEVNELRTSLNLRPGVPYIIAGNEESSDNFSRSFLGYMDGKKRKNMAIIISADVGVSE